MNWKQLPESDKADAVRATLARKQWEDSSIPMTKQLKQNPGKWAMVAHRSYRGGYSWYRQRGFRHATRARDGGWDHYLQWPDDE